MANLNKISTFAASKITPHNVFSVNTIELAQLPY